MRNSLWPTWGVHGMLLLRLGVSRGRPGLPRSKMLNPQLFVAPGNDTGKLSDFTQ